MALIKDKAQVDKGKFYYDLKGSVAAANLNIHQIKGSYVDHTHLRKRGVYETAEEALEEALKRMKEFKDERLAKF